MPVCKPAGTYIVPARENAQLTLRNARQGDGVELLIEGELRGRARHRIRELDKDSVPFEYEAILSDVSEGKCLRVAFCLSFHAIAGATDGDLQSIRIGQ